MGEPIDFESMSPAERNRVIRMLHGILKVPKKAKPRSATMIAPETVSDVNVLPTEADQSASNAKASGV
jgi:hypothetical protein